MKHRRIARIAAESPQPKKQFEHGEGAATTGSCESADAKMLLRRGLAAYSRTQLLILIFLLAVISCKQPQQNCAGFKTGKFISEVTINGVKKQTTSLRTSGLVIETYNGKTDTASIRWVNDCEYILQKLRPKTMAEKKDVDIKILTTSEKTYTFEFGIVGSAERMRGTATRIN